MGREVIVGEHSGAAHQAREMFLRAVEGQRHVAHGLHCKRRSPAREALHRANEREPPTNGHERIEIGCQPRGFGPAQPTHRAGDAPGRVPRIHSRGNHLSPEDDLKRRRGRDIRGSSEVADSLGLALDGKPGGWPRLRCRRLE